MFWSRRTWSELPADLAAVQYSAILPVGATEQHGPHLGCGVDTVLADKLCAAVAERTRVPMLPRLQEAVASFAADPLIERTLGRALRDEFVHYKTVEWESYHLSVSAWEIERYSHLF